MYSEVIVPVDGSIEAARAVRPATTVAQAFGVPLRMIAFHRPDTDGFELRAHLRDQVADLGGAHRTIETAVATRSPADHIRAVLAEAPGAILVMATRGHGRTAGVIGSVANQVVGSTQRPVLLIGPACEPDRFRMRGPMIVPCAADRSNDAALALTTEFAAKFAFEPTIVNVLTPVPVTTSVGGVLGVPETAAETTFVGHLAHRLEQTIETTINFEVLHSMHPGEAIAEHANEQRASLVVMTTRAATGLRRIAVGSVTAEVLRHVHCPVLTIRSDA